MSSTLFARIAGRSPRELGRLLVINLRHRLRRLHPDQRAARAADLAFDRQWQTDTSGMVGVRALALAGNRARHAVHYAPSNEAMLRAPVAELGLDPADYAFVDYGSGKGRMVMLAMQMGFARATGVELSAALCAIAERNLSTFAARAGTTTPGEIVAGDATAFRPTGRRLCVYLYNPFDDAVLTPVRAQLEQALRGGTDQIVVIYANPVHADVFAAPGWRAGPTLPDIATFIAKRPAG